MQYPIDDYITFFDFIKESLCTSAYFYCNLHFTKELEEFLQILSNVL